MGRLVLIVATLAIVALPSAAASPRAGPLRVAFVTYVDVSPPRRDLGWLAYRGFLDAVRDFGVEGRVLKVGPAGPASALALAARQKYDLIIAYIVELDAIASVADRFPKSRFLMVDFPLWKPRPANVAGSVFRVEQAGYLAGYLAALMERRSRGRHVVGSVGGFSYPVGVNPFIAGYRAGARKADPRVVTLNAWAYSWTDPAKCETVALAEIAEGAGVIFQVAGLCGVGALEAAKEQRVWGIGVDVDQSHLGPHILTSVVKRNDRAVYLSVERLVRGTFRTGVDSTYDLANGGVGLGKISPQVPKSFLPMLGVIRRDIIAGRITAPKRIT